MPKIDRSAFLYLDPKGNKDTFAQCSTCLLWCGEAKQLCAIHGDKVRVRGTASCGFYIHGSPRPEQTVAKIVTPAESGLVDRKVRCENCQYFDTDDSDCDLFKELNEEFPELFYLEEKVDKHGCCNANEPIRKIGVKESVKEPAKRIGLKMAAENPKPNGIGLEVKPGVYLVRHAKTALNSDSSRDKIRGWIDVPLDATGKEQTKEIAKQVAGYKPVKVYSSDLQRSAHTARAIADAAGIDSIKAERVFRPWNLGEFQGKSAANAVPIIKEHLQKDMQDKKIFGGESFAQFRDRYLEALKKVLDEFTKSGKNIVIVCHYRNLKLTEAWLAKGGSKNHEIDAKMFTTDDMPPGTIARVVPKGDDWAFEVVHKGATVGGKVGAS